jgi:hypothetical protein
MVSVAGPRRSVGQDATASKVPRTPATISLTTIPRWGAEPRRNGVRECVADARSGFRRILRAADRGSDRTGIVEPSEEALHPHVARGLLQPAREIGAGARQGTCHERDRSVLAAMSPPYRFKVHARRAERRALDEDVLELLGIHRLVPQYHRPEGPSHPRFSENATLSGRVQIHSCARSPVGRRGLLKCQTAGIRIGGLLRKLRGVPQGLCPKRGHTSIVPSPHLAQHLPGVVRRRRAGHGIRLPNAESAGGTPLSGT